MMDENEMNPEVAAEAPAMGAENMPAMPAMPAMEADMAAPAADDMMGNDGMMAA